MGRVVSEDAVRRGLGKIEAAAGARWLQGHLDDTLRPLLSEPWILDCDTTIKTLYGHQEGAEVGYNPHKPGRPSHAYHTFLMAGVRLVLDVVVTPGTRQGSQTSQAPLWDLLGRLGREHWPRLVRGDKDWGYERNMAACERAGLDYLFKLRLPEGPCSGTPCRRPRHNRTPPRGGQRVMRHFLPAAPIHRRPAPPAFAIAPLALSMLVTAPPAVLVALPGMALRSPAHPIAAAP